VSCGSSHALALGQEKRRAAGTVTQTANFLTTAHFEKTVNQKTGETFAHVSVDSKAGALETDFSLKLVTDGQPRKPDSVRQVVFAGKGWARGLKKDAVLAAIESDPEAPNKDIADRAGVSVRYVQSIKRQL